MIYFLFKFENSDLDNNVCVAVNQYLNLIGYTKIKWIYKRYNASRFSIIIFLDFIVQIKVMKIQVSQGIL